jgi:hypothetical protein
MDGILDNMTKLLESEDIIGSCEQIIEFETQTLV